MPTHLSATRRTRPGTSPGTIVVDPAAPKPKIQVIAYDDTRIEESDLARPQDAKTYIDRFPCVWVNVQGLGDSEVIAEIGAVFGIHGLALEDVVNTHQRPKSEEYDDQLFLVMRMLHAEAVGQIEQLSIFLGTRYVVTFLETDRDCFGPIRKRLLEHKGRIRTLGPDFLAYAIVDYVIDEYFPRLDALGEQLDDLEERVLIRPTVSLLEEIHATRRELLVLRRTMTSTREVVNSLIRDTGTEVTNETKLFLRDCYDHTIQILEIVESQREIATGVLEIYLSSVNNRMNDVMRVLTVIATLFIPLTFLVGLYGMNFDTNVSPWNMPELHWKFGYPVLLLGMAVLIVVELYLFRRKGWIGDGRNK